MPWWVIPLVFGSIYLVIQYAKRHPDRWWVWVLFHPFGATTDLAGAPAPVARASAGTYLAWGTGFIAIWVVLMYLGISARIIQLEEPVTLAVCFGSFLVGVTCLVAAGILWFRSRPNV